MKGALIVDDDKQILNLVAAFLEYAGQFSFVDKANSGEEALQIFEPGKYCIAVLDIIMSPMNGVDLAIKMRDLDKDLILIAITGYSELRSEANLAVAGFNESFLKPFEYKDFMDYIKNFDCGG